MNDLPLHLPCSAPAPQSPRWLVFYDYHQLATPTQHQELKVEHLLQTQSSILEQSEYVRDLTKSIEDSTAATKQAEESLPMQDKVIGNRESPLIQAVPGVKLWFLV